MPNYKELKTCKLCGETKPVGDFYRNHLCTDGYRNHCKECCSAQVRERYRGNADHQRQLAKDAYEAALAEIEEAGGFNP